MKAFRRNDGLKGEGRKNQLFLTVIKVEPVVLLILHHDFHSREEFRPVFGMYCKIS